jgi:hypothetical protein
MRTYGYELGAWATEVYIASGEFDREWQAWCDKHGDPEKNWGEFSKHIWSDTEDKASSLDKLEREEIARLRPKYNHVTTERLEQSSIDLTPYVVVRDEHGAFLTSKGIELLEATDAGKEAP